MFVNYCTLTAEPPAPYWRVTSAEPFSPEGWGLLVSSYPRGRWLQLKLAAIRGVQREEDPLPYSELGLRDETHFLGGETDGVA